MKNTLIALINSEYAKGQDAMVEILKKNLRRVK